MSDQGTCQLGLTRDQEDLRDEDSSCSLWSVLSSVLLARSSLSPQDLCLFITVRGAATLLWPTSGYSSRTCVFLPQTMMIMVPCHPKPNLKYSPPHRIRITLPEVNISVPVMIAQCHKLCHPSVGAFFAGCVLVLIQLTERTPQV